MKLSDLTSGAADALKTAGDYVTGFNAPTVRLGVTGLSRAGKTVFITALVRNLVCGGRLPFFAAQAEGRLVRAYLEPQPDDTVPRFAYEDHLAHLAADPPTWPEGTRRISQLRVTLEYQSTARLRRMAGAMTGSALGPRKLHVDIVDYPGEWIVDLGLMELDFATWSSQALALAEMPQRKAVAAPIASFLATLDASGDAEPTAIAGARAFTRYLEAARAAEPALTVLTPGRFLMPGDLAGSPVLTFFPLPASTGADEHGRLRTLLAKRFERYKSEVVTPFFRDHFSRIDRQIVLMDALAALNQGPAGLKDLSDAMTTVLGAFRPGENTWLSRLFRRRIDRVVFAATKADHLNRASHDRLEALMRVLADQAIGRASAAGADVRVLALAALRSTREAEARAGKDLLPCIVGTPLKGERVAGITFDGKTETALFPGDLPVDPSGLMTAPMSGGYAGADDVRVVSFRPPRIVLATGGGATPALPHIRLDRAVEFLIGDKLS